MLTEIVERLAGLGPTERIDRLREVDDELRRLEAEVAVLVDQVERDGVFREDGYLSVGGLLRGELRWSSAQVTARKRLAGLVRSAPVVVDHLARGVIGVAQAQLLGQVGANPRCGGQLAGHASLLVEHARVLSFQHFAIVARRWEHLADADGAHRDGEASHAARRVTLSCFGGVGRVEAKCGALDYAQFVEVFERYRQAEFLADWQAAAAEHGESVTVADLARSEGQRSWDALLRIAIDAASTGPGAQPPEPLVNLVCSVDVFQAELARCGLIDEADTVVVSVDQQRCETIDGVAVTPSEVLQAAIVGRVRRVVFDSAGVAVDCGRLRRLFDGAMRAAVMLQSPVCVMPGCDRPASWCQADHLNEWSRHGPTSTANGAPMCARHNRLKHHGFTVWRDPNGIYHTYRPDGSEIAKPRPRQSPNHHRTSTPPSAATCTVSRVPTPAGRSVRVRRTPR